MREFPPYHTRCLITISQSINVFIFNGYPDEMLCSRSYRLGWKCAVKFLDSIFFWQKEHCKMCYLWEKDRIDSPRFDDGN